MDRRLTEKEVAFLQDLRELMAKHSIMLYSENDHVCFDVEYSDTDDPVEPVTLPDGITVFYDLDDFIEQNS